MQPTQLSVTIITRNEEANIARCILSIKNVADEVVVVDSHSTDKTVEIATQLGAKVVQEKFRGHIEQKNFAITQSKNSFILSLDADEAIDEILEKEILAIKQNRQHDAYLINRFNNYCGKWIKHGAWYPDRKLRLWDSTKGTWAGINPHDSFEVQSGAKIATLSGNILHWSYKTVEEHKNKTHYFSDIAANAYLIQGKKSNTFKILFSPVFRFVRDYFFRLGFMDGNLGFTIARLTAIEVYLKYKKLLVLQKLN